MFGQAGFALVRGRAREMNFRSCGARPVGFARGYFDGVIIHFRPPLARPCTRRAAREVPKNRMDFSTHSPFVPPRAAGFKSLTTGGGLCYNARRSELKPFAAVEGFCFSSRSLPFRSFYLKKLKSSFIHAQGNY
ncbi:MAG TPA: hypothetical protein VIQ24_18660 [Pyrinomonadaceae bacterium]